MKTWLDLTIEISNNFKNRELNKYEPIFIDSITYVSWNGYIDSVLDITDSILERFDNFKFIGLDGSNYEVNGIITNLLDETHVLENGHLLMNSSGSEAIKNAISKILDLTYKPKNSCELIDILQELSYIRYIQNSIIHRYTEGLDNSLKYMKEVVYRSNDYQNLNEVSRSLGKRLIDKKLHPDFGIIKIHIKEQLDYLKTQFEFEKIVPPSPKQITENLILYQLPIRLSDNQRAKLFDLLIDGLFIPKSTSRESFLWAFGDKKVPEQWQPIKWNYSKHSFRVILTPIIKLITNEYIRNIEDLLLDKNDKRFKLGKDEYRFPKEIESIEYILSSLKVDKSRWYSAIKT